MTKPTFAQSLFSVVTSWWARLFARPIFYYPHLLLLHFSLRGLGILNYTSTEISGEKNVWQFIQKKHQPKIVFDVGAFAYENVRDLVTFFPQATVHAFEPNPKNFKRMLTAANKEQIISRNQLHNIGLSNKRQTIKLWDHANTQGSSHASIYKDVFNTIHKSNAKSYQASFNTLDAIIKQLKVDHIDFLKIDTEGHELMVLEGGKKALKAGKIKMIQFEFNSMNISSRTFFYDLRSILTDYDLYRLLPNSLLPLPSYDVVTQEIFAYQNILAVHKTAKKK